jgi:hypothetical protein
MAVRKRIQQTQADASLEGSIEIEESELGTIAAASVFGGTGDVQQR